MHLNTRVNAMKSRWSHCDQLKQFEQRNKVLRDESRQLGNYINQTSNNTSQKVYYGTGKLHSPCWWVHFISFFEKLAASPDILRRRHFTPGMDFAAPREYRIKAVDSGKVLFSGFKRGYGNVTIINHGWRKIKEFRLFMRISGR